MQASGSSSHFSFKCSFQAGQVLSYRMTMGVIKMLSVERYQSKVLIKQKADNLLNYNETGPVVLRMISFGSYSMRMMGLLSISPAPRLFLL